MKRERERKENTRIFQYNYIMGSLKPDSNFTVLNSRFYGTTGYFLPVNGDNSSFCLGLI